MENRIKDNSESALVSVVVPVFNGGDDFDRCLEAVFRSDWPEFECIVVDDASSNSLTAEIATRHGARLVRMEQQGGPGMARNRGVEKAGGDIIFFTDGDVMLYPDALGKAVAALEADPELAAVFGSYDDTPGYDSFLSRYRNLYHHWNHQVSSEEAFTFWAGCGAIRREIFLEMGGFSADYSRPSIEDVELGYRLRDAGYRIRLLKTMLGTHLKQWTFWDMLRTDIFRRGVPWVVLLLRYRSAPPDLNVNFQARVAMVSSFLLVLAMMLLPITGHATAVVPALAFIVSALICSRLVKNSDSDQTGQGWKSPLAFLIGILVPLGVFIGLGEPWALLPLALIGMTIGTQPGFYQLLARRGGIAFAIAVVPLQLLFFIGCTISVVLGFFAWFRRA